MTELSRRARLLEVAIDRFTHYGVKRTSIEDVAADAGIAKGSVYLEFRGKAELFRAAAAHLIGEILVAAEAIAASDGALEDRVTDLLCAKFWRIYDLVHAHPHARELIEAKDAHAVDLFRAADDRYAALLERVLAAADWQVPTGELTAVLLRTAHGTGYGAARLTAAAYRKRIALAVGLVLRGAATPPKSPSPRRR